MSQNIPKYIFVHHTGGTELNPLADTSHHTFEMVNAEHRNNPRVWLGHLSSLGFAIGYHYFISKEGKVTQGRMIADEGAHCVGYNLQSIGICLAGNFDLTFPTELQVKALTSLLVRLKVDYPVPILPHRAKAAKSCYGRNLSDTWASDLLTTPVATSCAAEKEEITRWKMAYNWIDELLKKRFRI